MARGDKGKMDESALGFETGEPWCPVCEEYGHDLVECEYMDQEQPCVCGTFDKDGAERRCVNE